MKKRKILLIIIPAVLLVGLLIYAYAAGWLTAKTDNPVDSDISKTNYLKVTMTAPVLKGEIIPGGQLSWSAVVTNTGNVSASAFIKLVQPSYEGQPVYELVGNDSWKLVTSTAGESTITQIWGYGGDTLTFIDAGETTGSLMTGIQMIDIDGTAYNSIADLNVSMEGYLVEADAGDNPAEAWSVVGE